MPSLTTEQKLGADLLRSAMDALGITDNALRAGLPAIIMGESRFVAKFETDYSHTPNSRIRTIFGSRVSALSDAYLDALKADPKAFFNRVYGGVWGRGNLGNIQPNDGWDYRGGGWLQLTGRANYAQIGADIGIDLISNPELVNAPDIAAKVAVAYMKRRYKGGGWDRMLSAVGNNSADIRATKDEWFRSFQGSGYFDVGGAQPQVGPTNTVLVELYAKVVSLLGQAQTALKDGGYYTGAVDGDWGALSRTAFAALKRDASK